MDRLSVLLSNPYKNQSFKESVSVCGTVCVVNIEERVEGVCVSGIDSKDGGNSFMD